jgi:hypothetical protein
MKDRKISIDKYNNVYIDNIRIDPVRNHTHGDRWLYNEISIWEDACKSKKEWES